MDAFKLYTSITNNYRSYLKSFLNVIYEKISFLEEDTFNANVFGQKPLILFYTSFLSARPLFGLNEVCIDTLSTIMDNEIPDKKRETPKKIQKRLLLLNYKCYKKENTPGLHNKKDVEKYYYNKSRPPKSITYRNKKTNSYKSERGTIAPLTPSQSDTDKVVCSIKNGYK